MTNGSPYANRHISFPTITKHELQVLITFNTNLPPRKHIRLLYMHSNFITHNYCTFVTDSFFNPFCSLNKLLASFKFLIIVLLYIDNTPYDLLPNEYSGGITILLVKVAIECGRLLPSFLCTMINVYR